MKGGMIPIQDYQRLDLPESNEKCIKIIGSYSTEHYPKEKTNSQHQEK